MMDRKYMQLLQKAAHVLNRIKWFVFLLLLTIQHVLSINIQWKNKYRRVQILSEESRTNFLHAVIFIYP